MVSIMAAMARNRVIGKEGRIPWSIPGEQTWFRQVTWGKPVILGRVSWEEIGGPLPGRELLVLTRGWQAFPPGVRGIASLEEAWFFCRDAEEIVVAGGAQVYRQAMPYAKRIYLSVLEMEAEGDTFFPCFERKGFSEQSRVFVPGKIPYTRYIYERPQPEKALPQ